MTAGLQTVGVRHSAITELSSNLNSGFIERKKVEMQLCERAKGVCGTWQWLRKDRCLGE